MEFASARMVEAIEEGKIVKVSEDYARRERLMILRKISSGEAEPVKEDIKKKLGEEKRYRFDDFRKPLNWGKNRIVEDLIDNFHWEVSRMRKVRGLTRKQLAVEIGANENEVKAIENGIIPTQDFILISKIEAFFGISLRKEKREFSTPLMSDFEESEDGTEQDLAN